jgi:hypothetical protein
MEVLFKQAADYRPMQVRATAEAGPVLAMTIWGTSITGILRAVMDQAIELGREYRPQITAAARLAVDAVAEFDLPYIPPSIEGVIDEATQRLGYAAIDAVLDAVLGV